MIPEITRFFLVRRGGQTHQFELVNHPSEREIRSHERQNVLREWHFEGIFEVIIHRWRIIERLRSRGFFVYFESRVYCIVLFHVEFSYEFLVIIVHYRHDG